MKIAFYKARGHLVNRVISWWEHGPYSHAELVLGALPNGLFLCGSSSARDGGVREKVMPLPRASWDLIDLPVTREMQNHALCWFDNHSGEPYDWAGLLGFIYRPYRDMRAAWWCDEAVAEALVIPDSWRYGVNTLYSTLLAMGATKIEEQS